MAMTYSLNTAVRCIREETLAPYSSLSRGGGEDSGKNRETDHFGDWEVVKVDWKIGDRVQSCAEACVIHYGNGIPRLIKASPETSSVLSL